MTYSVDTSGESGSPSYRGATVKSLAVLFLLFAWSLSAPRSSAAANEDGFNAGRNGAFFDPERYHYFEDSLVIEFNLQRRQDVSSFSGIVFSILSNDGKKIDLLIDWRQGRTETPVYLLYQDRMNIFPIRDSLLFIDPIYTPVRMMLDFRRDLIVVSIGGHDIPMRGTQLSVQSGYKFSLLPVLSDSPDPNVYPVLKIDSLEISYNKQRFMRSFWYWFVLIIAVDLTIFLWIHLKRRRVKRLLASRHNALRHVNSNTDLLVPPEIDRKSAVFLFGSFQVFSREGEDITKRFSPLLKELFCLILTHSSKKGISSDKLNELLWFDKDRVSAKNNRAVNLGKLRGILDQIGQYDLSNDTGYWKFESTEIFVDYLEFVKFMTAVGSPPLKEDVELLSALIRNGNLLSDENYRWTDGLKSHISDQVVDMLWSYAQGINPEKHPEQVLQIASLIFGFEPINEQALYLRCKSYNVTGRHSSAKREYDRFRDEYEVVYGEQFPYSFTDLLNKSDWE